MNMFSILLASSLLLCTMVAGFLFAYAVVIMPGIKCLEDKEFLMAFKVTDKIIQDNNPFFMLVWVGSALNFIVLALIGYDEAQGTDFWLLMIIVVMYVAGVQLITMFVHLPLNNKIQKLDFDAMERSELKEVRISFESRWNTFNNIRTMVSIVVSILLIVLY